MVASKASWWFPALLTSTSIRLAAPRMRATAACQALGSVTSNSTQRQRSGCSAASCSACSRRWRKPSQTTLSAASSRKARAMDCPRPPLAPVTKMTRELMDCRAASSSPSSPREERVGRGPRRGETNKNAPPLPSPLLHPMEERAKSRSLMQPSLPGDPVTVEGFTDLAVNGLKFSGNAQRRKRRCLLFHGTFLLDLDLALVEKLLRPPSRQPAYRENRSRAEFLTVVGW